MPRIAPRAIREAVKTSRLLPPLLRANRCLEGAKQELKWIQNELPEDKWKDAVLRRAKLEPLQYILGTQPFGELDILCKEGVLIPRWETEEWTNLLADQLVEKFMHHPLAIVDACSGSGCIPLLLNHRLKDRGIIADIRAFDISEKAYELIRANLALYQEVFGQDISNFTISKANLLNSEEMAHLAECKPDLIVSNPPYIPIRDYNLPVLLNGVERSVREYEPKLALVGENEFYSALIENLVLPLGAEGFVFELGYMEQVDCVKQLLEEKEPKKWETGTYRDSGGNIRCIIGWLRKSPMSFLQNMCN